MADSGAKRGCLEELQTIRGFVGIVFMTPYAVHQLLAGNTRSGFFWLAFVGFLTWLMYRDLRPEGYRLGDRRRSRRATRKHSA